MILYMQQVDYYQRDDAGVWQVAALTSQETILVQCGGEDAQFRAGLCLDDIYEDVIWR